MMVYYAQEISASVHIRSTDIRYSLGYKIKKIDQIVYNKLVDLLRSSNFFLGHLIFNVVRGYFPGMQFKYNSESFN